MLMTTVVALHVGSRNPPLGTGDEGGEELHGVPVEVAACNAVVLGGPGIGVAAEDLGVRQRHAGIQGVGDRGVP
jgi:hypothetical protein